MKADQITKNDFSLNVEDLTFYKKEKRAVSQFTFISEIALPIIGLSFLFLTPPFIGFTTIGICSVAALGVAVFAIRFFINQSRQMNGFKAFAEFKQNHSQQIPENKNVTLVLETRRDLNQAFAKEDTEIFKKFEKDSNVVIFKKIDSNDDISKIINETVQKGNNITTLFVRAHGNHQKIRLSKNETLDPDKLKDTFKLLKAKAWIILDSCMTGGKMLGNQQNIAQKIAKAAPGKIIFAPAVETYAGSIQLTDEKEPSIKIIVKGKDVAQRYCVE